MSDKITIDRAVLEQALEALEMMSTPSPLVFLPDEIQSWQNANEALRAALEQPQVEQEPVAWMYDEAKYGPTDLRGQQWRPALSWAKPYTENGMVRELTPLYTHPKPPREPLTDEQIRDLFTQDIAYERLIKLIRIVEEAHGIKDNK